MRAAGSRAGRWAARTLAGLAGAAAVAGFVGLGAWTAARPPHAGRRGLPGLTHPVEVLRDRFGVPHLFARDERDLFRSLGYVMAQDRLVQMDLSRRAASGRLAEWVGPAALAHDRRMRTLGLARLGDALLARLPSRTRAMLDAFTDGVNARIRQGPTPFEYRLLGGAPAPWTARDSAAIAKYMAWDLSQWEADLLLTRLVERLGSAAVSELFGWLRSPLLLPARLPDPLKGLAGAKPALLTRGPAAPARLGSNAWAVGGRRSASGKPLLAADPHLALRLPSTWYEVHLSAPGWEVAGAALAGLPAVVIGRTPHHAWGMTNAMLKDMDLFLEEVEFSTAPPRYRAPEGWRPLEVVQEAIAVKGEASLTHAVYATPRGPLIGDGPRPGTALALCWTAARAPADELSAILGLATAANLQEFRASLRTFGAPAQQVLYADVEGHLALQFAGAVPKRAPDYAPLVQLGWTGRHDWRGWVPFETLPFEADPTDGVLITANHQPAPAGFFLSHLWMSGDRRDALTRTLTSSGAWTADRFEALQRDVTWSGWPRVKPWLLSAAEAKHPRLLPLLNRWDGRLAEDSAAAGLVTAWMRAFAREALSPLAPELWETWSALWDWDAHALDTLLLRSQAAPPSPLAAAGALHAAAASALDSALKELTDRGGHHPLSWKLGRFQRFEFQHALGKGVLAPLLNPAPLPVPGSSKTVFAMDAARGVGPSYRHVVDLADPGSARTVLPPGQSEHPWSPHYADQIGRWRRGPSKRVVMDRKALLKDSPLILMLEPSSP